MPLDDEVREFADKKLGLDKTVLLTYRGSIAHNMYIPSDDPDSIDDIDMLAVYLEPPGHYLSLKRDFSKGKEFMEGKFDLVAYEFRKFVYLLAKNNPNVLSTLWLCHKHYLHASDTGVNIVKLRDVFLSKRIFKTFGGYARGQLKRMTHFKFNGYMGKKRKELVERFGYDTKNAAHLIRLLRMAAEALETGALEVFRVDDADELIRIKRGMLSLEEVKEEANILEGRMRRALEKSRLPHKPDYDRINSFVFETLKDYINKGVV